MATAISSAFQSNKTEDEQSYQPTRRAPPIPAVAYNTTVASRVPEQGERPIYQANTTSIRQQQHEAAQQPASRYHYYPEQTQQTQSSQQLRYQQNSQQQVHSQSLSSRPSTQQTSISQPAQASLRGRQNTEKQPDPSTLASTPQNPQVQRTQYPPHQQKKRSNSFSFLRRSSSTQPTTRIAQVQATAGASNHQSQSSEGSITSSNIFRTRSRDKSERNMLRKQSKFKQQQEELERQQRLAEVASQPAPRLPETERLPYIESFGGDAPANTPPSAAPAAANFSRPSAANNTARASATSPPPASLNGGRAGEYYEQSGERAASMTNRGRYSYASSTAQAGGNVNSPRRVRRRKDPTPFNVLVIGTKNSGKTSFISFLRNSLASRGDKQDVPVASAPAKSTFTSHYLETEIDGERVGVTLWDSAGLEKNIVDLQLREMTAFIESKFEDTFGEEQKVVRSPGFRDTHIHCVFLVLDPIRLDANVAASTSGTASSGLDEDVDLQVLKTLWGKTSVIPVIAKADTLTTSHMIFLKRAVWQSIKNAKLSPLDALELDDEEDEDDEDDEDAAEGAGEFDDGCRGDQVDIGGPRPKRSAHARQASLSSTISDDDPYIPMSILSPDPYSMPPHAKYAPRSQSEIGRRYAWGFASPFDPQHCDFIRLRDTIFSEWRGDLRELSRVKWYEQWRTSRLRHAPAVKKAVVPSSGIKPLPFRDPADYCSNGRNFSSVQQSEMRSTQQPVSQQAPVGVAVTTPGLAS